MQPCLLRTTVIGSYPFPGWLELASEQLDRFGPADLAELQDDAVVAAIHDQVAAGLGRTGLDGEIMWLYFNLSFYGLLKASIARSSRHGALGRRARPARQAQGDGRTAGAARAWRCGGVQAVEAYGRRRSGAEERACPVLILERAAGGCGPL